MNLKATPGMVVRRHSDERPWAPIGFTATVKPGDPASHHREAQVPHIIDAEGDHYHALFDGSQWEIVETPIVDPTLTDEQRQLRDLRKAAAALYLEGRWSLPVTDGVPADTQEQLWANLRDALGFKPGFNTVVSSAE